MRKILILRKKEGDTPLQALEAFRAKNKKYKEKKMTYAGRLDPMASGILLILADEEIKNKEKYLAFDKEYKFQILFGLATDTYDILGKLEHSNILQNVGMFSRRELEKKIKENIRYFTGRFVQEYPIYSSKTVAGRQLFEYGRRGEDVEIPKKEVIVKSLKYLGTKKITPIRLLKSIESRILKVKGDFRQEEILKIWRESLSIEHSVFNTGFFVADFYIKCGSGTYVRGIANSLGEKIGVPALAFRIKRTRLGKWI
jgi:tRNA pseudouridine55 synthase